MRKILIYHDFPQKVEIDLEGRFKEMSAEVCKDMETMLKHIPGAEILITNRYNPGMLEMAKNLKWMHVLSAGVDFLPLEYIRDRGIVLTNSRGIHKTQMSEYAVWAMISLARNTHTMFRNQIKGQWDRQIPQGEIAGSTVGIIGLGSIGKEIAKKASALGMRVIGVKRTIENVDHVEKVYSLSEIKEVFKESDYIINLLPYTPITDKVFNKDYFELMKDTACFIHIGRGKTVNEEDLIDALRANRIRALVADVFYDEPLSPDSPLWRMENVVLTPHICGVSLRYVERAMEIVDYNLNAYLSGREMMNVIDFERRY